MQQSYRQKWEEFTKLLLDSIDIKAVCESWGLKFTGRVSDRGWAECHAHNRPDNDPSAAVNLMNGLYKDLAGGPAMPLFMLGVVLGPYGGYHECLMGVAKDAKMLSKIPRSTQGESFWSKLRFRDWNDIVCINLCRELGVTPDVLRMIGGSMALTGQDDVAVAFTVMDMAGPLSKEQAGIVCMNANGGKLEHYQGKGKPVRHERNISRGSAGILNQHAITHWGEAEVIYKVEGISDMIVLQNAIPEDMRSTHLVVTNSDGCDSLHSPMAFADMIKGKNVIFIHDHDEPGQFGNATDKTGGAAKWEAAAKATAKSVLNLDLYPDEELPPKHGKDLRDWFAEGHTYDDLCVLANGHQGWWTRPESANGEGDIELEPEGQNLDEFQEILRKLHLIVLGHTKTGQVTVFNMKTCRKFQITDVDKFSYNKQLIHIGEAAREHIKDPMDFEAPDHLIDASDVRTAISREAGRKELSRSNTVGIGLWESGGRAFAVGVGEWIAVNGGVEVYHTPTVDDKIIDFGEVEESWYNKDLLQEYLELAKSPKWRIAHLEEMSSIFGRWKNNSHPMAGPVMSCLLIGTWAQAILDWRPWIAITGESAAGKTVLMNLISRYFGALGLPSGDASVAGIRNTIGNSSRILLLDEFESSEHREKILGMLMSSSRRGEFGTSLRSNAAQGSVRSEYQLMPWFSATEIKRDRQTEANRFITFELNSMDNGDRILIPTDEELEVLRNKSLAICLRCWQSFKDLNELVVASLRGEYFRQSESYSIVSAIYGGICGYSGSRSIDFHNNMINQLKGENTIEDEQKEHEMALNAILSSQVQVGGGKLTTVANLLTKERGDGWDATPEEILRAHGIRRVPHSDMIKQADWKRARKAEKAMESSYVFLDVSGGGMIRRKLLRGTSYEKQDLGAVLSRLKDSFKGLFRVGGVVRGVFIPASLVHAVDEKDFGDVEMDDDLTDI